MDDEVMSLIRDDALREIPRMVISVKGGRTPPLGKPSMEEIWEATGGGVEALRWARAYQRVGQLYGAEARMWSYMPAFVRAVVERPGDSLKQLMVWTLVELRKEGSFMLVPQLDKHDVFALTDSSFYPPGHHSLVRCLISVLVSGVAKSGSTFGTSIEMHPELTGGAIYAEVAPQVFPNIVLRILHELVVRTVDVVKDEPWLKVLELESTIIVWTIMVTPMLERDSKAIIMSETLTKIQHPITHSFLNTLTTAWHTMKIPWVLWDRYIVDNMPPVPIGIGEMIDVTSIAKAAATPLQSIRWLRAYYKTGQLDVRDRPLALLEVDDLRVGAHDVSTGTVIHGLQFQYHDFLKYPFRHIALATVPGQVTPAMQAVVREAVATFTFSQHALYRLHQFSHLLRLTAYPTQQVPHSMRSWTRSALTEELAGILEHEDSITLGEWTPGDLKEVYERRWGGALEWMERVELQAYRDTMWDILMKQVDNRLDESRSLINRRRTKGMAPMVQAYLHLIRAMLRDPVDPIGEAVKTAPYPPMYQAEVPTLDDDWNKALTPVLNDIVAQYTFMPSFDTVLSRLSE